MAVTDGPNEMIQSLLRRSLGAEFSEVGGCSEVSIF